MSNGTLTLQSKIEDCEVGVQKEITVLCTPKTNDDASGFTADVDEVVDYAEDERAEGGKSYPTKPSPSVSIVIASGKKK